MNTREIFHSLSLHRWLLVLCCLPAAVATAQPAVNPAATPAEASDDAIGNETQPTAKPPVVLTAADRQRIDELIADLSSSKFATREEAGAALIEIGEPVIPMLAAAADTPDPEVQLRIRILMSRLSNNDFESAVTAFLSGGSDEMDGWDYARRLIGDSKASRELFVDAARSHRELMVELEKGPGPRMVAANKAADLVVRRMMLEFLPPERGDAVALLLTCGDRSAPIPPGVERVLVRIMNSQVTSQTLKDAMLAPVYQKLVGFWMRRASVSYQPQAMYFALQHRIPEAVDLAREVIADFIATGTDLSGEETVDPKYSESLEQALLVVAKYGDPSDLPRLQPLTIDARRMPIGADQPDDTRDPIAVHVRDIAVAVSIKLLGGDLREAGYLNPREHATVVFFTASLGFPGDGDELRAKPAKYLADRLAKP
ncbi:hypothetical protein Poly24_34390 [Rosistilla carotiformis]|uniref:HEAT repeat protein n=1 Tax=Rosistilla carotiformis TaxID=2528017 RepID=A0A518JW06_9BACT|nr:hypothetical protein [Rosistilla carotiformis]QDV69722.1 hypothetical protein Poly24_34390 [Rosistilla carotiformis]